MEFFNNSRDFYIKNLFASDGTGGKDVVAMALMKELASAACLGAGHQSGERYDAPKCHPETRAAVINDIMSWVNAKDSKEPIMWMSGPAGAGKSAIAQTVCEKCHSEKKLLASFFFSRTAIGTGRNEGNRLVPTIAYQAAITIPEVKTMIVKQLERDSATLSYSMEKLLQVLVLEPLARMDTNISLNKQDNRGKRTQYVVVVDGLDECNDPNVQSRIVKMVASKGNINLRFLIASRPELEIRTSFESIIVEPMCARIILDEKYRPDDDIRTYLLSEFATLKREHTLQKYLLQELDWPSSTDIDMLVEKSSGQFIYSSTVIRYLNHPRRDPRQGLREILGVPIMKSNSTQKESPYAPLDSLYIHILCAASEGIPGGSYDSYKNVFEILLFSYKGSASKEELPLTFPNLSIFIGINHESELDLLLADLHSILYIPESSGSVESVKFYHASFGDFLKNSDRSGIFSLSQDKAHTNLAKLCSSVLETETNTGNLVRDYAVKYLFSHFADGGCYRDLVLHSTGWLIALKELTRRRFYEPLESLMEFSFDYDRLIYWLPRTEGLTSICSSIVWIVENEFMQISPNIIIEGPYFTALRSIAVLKIGSKYDHTPEGFHPSIYDRWLGYFFESPHHGKHLYIDSKIGRTLYDKLFSASCILDDEFVKSCCVSDDVEFIKASSMYKHDLRRIIQRVDKLEFLFILEYVLTKIESFDLQIDRHNFPSLEEHALEYMISLLDERHTTESKFITECRSRFMGISRPKNTSPERIRVLGVCIDEIRRLHWASIKSISLRDAQTSKAAISRMRMKAMSLEEHWQEARARDLMGDEWVRSLKEPERRRKQALADVGNASPQSWGLGIIVLTTMVMVYWVSSRRV